MFLDKYSEIVVTVTNKSGKYVKLTIEDTVESIANFILSAQDDDNVLRFFDKFQDKSFFVNEESVTDAEKIAEISKKIREIEKGKGERLLKVYIFWFADEYNNLQIFRETVKQAGFKIDSSTWLDCVEKRY